LEGQLLKDGLMSNEDVTLAGKNAPEAQRGETIVLYTIERMYPNQ
jgi:hypothetical protein